MMKAVPSISEHAEDGIQETPRLPWYCPHPDLKFEDKVPKINGLYNLRVFKVHLLAGGSEGQKPAWLR